MRDSGANLTTPTSMPSPWRERQTLAGGDESGVELTDAVALVAGHPIEHTPVSERSAGRAACARPFPA